MAGPLLTRDEFLGGLCGIDADVVAATSPADWSADLYRAANLVEAAWDSKELTVYYWHALTMDEPFGNYTVDRDQAIRLALRHAVMFPGSRFTAADLLLESSSAAPQSTVAARKPTPLSPAPPTEWADVELRFLSELKLQAVVNARLQEPWNYAEMGFEDRRTGKPTKAWETLIEIARAAGVLKVDRSPNGYAEQAKRIEEIRKNLRSKFSLAANPLPLKNNTYRARFKVILAEAFKADR